jgi:hypothetical protein
LAARKNRTRTAKRGVTRAAVRKLALSFPGRLAESDAKKAR